MRAIRVTRYKNKTGEHSSVIIIFSLFIFIFPFCDTRQRALGLMETSSKESPVSRRNSSGERFRVKRSMPSGEHTHTHTHTHSELRVQDLKISLAASQRTASPFERHCRLTSSFSASRIYFSPLFGRPSIFFQTYYPRLILPSDFLANGRLIARCISRSPLFTFAQGTRDNASHAKGVSIPFGSNEQISVETPTSESEHRIYQSSADFHRLKMEFVRNGESSNTVRNILQILAILVRRSAINNTPGDKVR